MRGNPGATWLSVSDGMTAIGVVIDTRARRPRAPAAPSYAFDDHDRFIGEFANRRVAARAISVRCDHDLEQSLPSRSSHGDWRLRPGKA